MARLSHFVALWWGRPSMPALANSSSAPAWPAQGFSVARDGEVSDFIRVPAVDD